MRISAIVVSAIASLLVAPSMAWACGCGSVNGESFETGVVRQLSSAERVLVRRVIRWDEGTVTFAVEAQWKGDDGEVSLKHGEIPGPGVVTIDTCDFRFREIGRRYLVFADRAGASLKAGICGHTKPLEESQRVIAVLNTAAGRRTPQQQPAK